MLKWKKAATAHGMYGERVITYRAEGCPLEIESRRKAIRHANGEGYWYYTEYALIYPDGAGRVFARLRDAQEAVEKEWQAWRK